MIEVVSVRFKSSGKVYYFDPSGLELSQGQQVIVETSKGLEIGECVKGNHSVPEDRIVPPLRPVIRVATEEDLRVAENNKAKEKEAFEICLKKIAEHGLDMKLVDVEYNFEGSKIMFFFTSDGRVDFRELVKDLASVFRTRIELRQIGVRDEAKMLGGLGICGRPFCCSQFLDEFQPVSTKMAKIQSMSLNPTKISGACGRLMCCLRYEHEAYEELVKNAPKNGAFVETPLGYGNVIQVNLLRQTVKVNIDSTGEPVLRTFSMDEVAVVPGGRPKEGEPLPSVLQIVPKMEEEESEFEMDPWEMPMLLVDDHIPEETPETPAPAKKKSSKKSRSRAKAGEQQSRKAKNQNQKETKAQGAQKSQGKKGAQPKARESEKTEKKRPNNKNRRKKVIKKPKTNQPEKSPKA
ncbi:MAG TPA: stage 0 sporulation family protein [Clostridiales bacterium]|nr:stage 0 sporulation family protein [Clostridiales bacterium]